MTKVNVLLPTYNGEKYLSYQLDSLVNQTYKDFDVYIRDDGSTDKTVSIIDDYCNTVFEGIRFHKVDSENKKLGYPDCFWELVKKTPEADYIAFCDQDDYWEPNKIETAIRYLEPYKEEAAITYCSFDYCDGEMNYLRSGDNYRENPKLVNGMYYTFSPGFTQVFNKKLRTYLDCDFLMNKKIAHDIWCQWIGLTFGIMLPQKELLAKYRRHENAVTAANKGILKSILEWMDHEILGDAMTIWKRSLTYFYEKYEDILDDESKVLLKVIVLDTPKNRLLRIFKVHNLRPSLGGNIAIKLLFILKKC